MTVKEIAVKNKVSTVSIYNRINHTLKQELKGFIIKREGVTYILPKGIEMIEDSLANKEVKEEITTEVTSEEESGPTKEDVKEILERLNRLEEGYIETLKRELEEKNEQLRGKYDLFTELPGSTERDLGEG